MSVRDAEMPEFRAFRQHVEAWALRQLIDTNPAYVQTFKRRMSETGDDVLTVIKETAPLLKGPTTWHKVLTALLDVELYLDRCKQALWFLGSTPVASPPASAPPTASAHPGAWLLYHFDTWHMVACALLERIHILIALTCRNLIRPKNARFKIIEAQLVAEVQKMKQFIEDARNNIAHGGGSVEAMTEDKFWEPYLVVGQVPGGTDAIDIIGNYYDSAIRYHASWHSRAQRFTKWIFAFSGTWFRKLTEEAFPETGR